MSLNVLTNLLQKQPRPAFSEKAPETPCVYYLCSHDNFLKIQKSGYLLPRNAVSDLDSTGDLSCAGIQKRRTRHIDLGDGGKNNTSHDPHDCINFFFNPHNSTFQAFLRNSYLAKPDSPDLLILSFPLDSISKHLKDKKHQYACSGKNIAAEGFTTSHPVEYQRFDWLKILSQNSEEKSRSAEFFLWINPNETTSDLKIKLEDQPSLGLPLLLANAIYHHPAINQHKLEEVRFPHHPYHHAKKTSDLFLYDTRLLEYLKNRAALGIDELLPHFSNLIENMPFALADNSFLTENNADSYIHGYPHVSKVMFWTSFLTHPKILPQVLLQESDQHLALDAMLAALIHDLRRENDREDEIHGQQAMNYYKDLVLEFTAGDIARFSRIGRAVSDHCRPDEQAHDKNNPVWQILKDADAIDRGRFAPPCDGQDYNGTNCIKVTCRHRGCAYQTLRLNYSTIGGAENLSWAAWNLAGSTKSAAWAGAKPLAHLIHHIKTCAKLVQNSY